MGALLLGLCQRWLEDTCVHLLLDTICLLIFGHITVHKLFFKLSYLNFHSAFVVCILLVSLFTSFALLLCAMTRNVAVGTTLYGHFFLIVLNLCLL